MKSPWLAFLLSLIVPGAGLVYLGKWRAGLANFCLATAIVGGFLIFRSETSMDYIHYVILAVATGSAGLAHARATRIAD